MFKTGSIDYQLSISWCRISSINGFFDLKFSTRIIGYLKTWNLSSEGLASFTSTTWGWPVGLHYFFVDIPSFCWEVSTLKARVPRWIYFYHLFGRIIDTSALIMLFTLSTAELCTVFSKYSFDLVMVRLPIIALGCWRPEQYLVNMVYLPKKGWSWDSGMVCFLDQSIRFFCKRFGVFWVSKFPGAKLRTIEFLHTIFPTYGRGNWSPKISSIGDDSSDIVWVKHERSLWETFGKDWPDDCCSKAGHDSSSEPQCCWVNLQKPISICSSLEEMVHQGQCTCLHWFVAKAGKRELGFVYWGHSSVWATIFLRLFGP